MSKVLIHDKLITDFTAFEFSGGNTMFNSVQKTFHSSQQARDCLIVPGDPSNEKIGNTFDRRMYTFESIIYELYEESDNQTEIDKKIDRLSNIEDKIMDYLQKEPNNLRSWGQGLTPIIDVIKIDVSPGRYEYQRTDSGYAIVLYIRFVINLLITPQLL